MNSDRIFVSEPLFAGNEKKYLLECVETGWVSANGRFVAEFEQRFAEFCGAEYAVSFANGTVSLHLATLMSDVGDGDEVIMPTLTYIATANAVRYCGGKPVFVDSDPVTWNIDASQIEKKITSRTKAIMPVHLYGCPCDMKKINEIAQKYGLIVIEDAAEAHGASFSGQKVGTLSKVGSFSFFGNKIMTSGEGGMLVTDDLALYEKIKLYKSQGMDPSRRYWHTVVGYNYRMTNMQAAIGLAQLEQVDDRIADRRRIRRLYEKYLGHLRDAIQFQGEQNGAESVYWMTTIVLTENAKASRAEVMQRMEEANIETRPIFYPMHIMPPYFEADGHYPVAEYSGERGICLPSHSRLTEEMISYVAGVVSKAIR